MYGKSKPRLRTQTTLDQRIEGSVFETTVTKASKALWPTVRSQVGIDGLNNATVLRAQSGALRFSGFYLMEILVALFIFAVVGTVSAQLLGRTLDAYQVLDDRGNRLAQIHRAMFVVQRDMLQYQDRSVRTATGDSFPALMIGDEGSLEMTRGGWRNPLQRPRSDLQRVAYRLQGEDLIRAYWPVLDRLGDEEPLTQTILEDVDDLEFL